MVDISALEDSSSTSHPNHMSNDETLHSYSELSSLIQPLPPLDPLSSSSSSSSVINVLTTTTHKQHSSSSTTTTTVTSQSHQKRRRKRTLSTSSSAATVAATTEQQQQLYCVCKSQWNDDSGDFMIACEGGCDGWFHPLCVSLTEKEAQEDIEVYYCSICRQNNPSLHIRYVGRRLNPDIRCISGNCDEPRRPNSRYCSSICAERMAWFRLYTVIRCMSNISVAESTSDADRYDKTLRERLTVSQDMNNIQDMSNVDSIYNVSNIDVDTPGLECQACGRMLSVRSFLSHRMKCFNKNEATTPLTMPAPLSQDEKLSLCGIYDKSARGYCSKLRVFCDTHARRRALESTMGSENNSNAAPVPIEVVCSVCSSPLPCSWHQDHEKMEVAHSARRAISKLRNEQHINRERDLVNLRMSKRKRLSLAHLFHQTLT